MSLLPELLDLRTIGLFRPDKLTQNLHQFLQRVIHASKPRVLVLPQEGFVVIAHCPAGGKRTADMKYPEEEVGLIVPKRIVPRLL